VSNLAVFLIYYLFIGLPIFLIQTWQKYRFLIQKVVAVICVVICPLPINRGILFVCMNVYQLLLEEFTFLLSAFP
jgi:hypothetical protein